MIFVMLYGCFNMKILIDKSYTSSGYETFSGFMKINKDTIPFRVGRYNREENYFEEDLKGNLKDFQVTAIFKKVDLLRKQKKTII